MTEKLRRPPVLPHRCGGCTARFGGERTCHCAAAGCHRTFSGVVTFDAHRAGGRCVDPARSAKFAEVRPGVWGSSESRPDFYSKPGNRHPR